MEYLDIVDEYGEPTGKTEERSVVHELGLPHRTAHVWLTRRRPEGVEVLLQLRSDDKDCFPGCYDTSSAGHIPAGQGFAESALRELKEELGVDAREEDLIHCGDFRIVNQDVFHGRLFKDDAYSRVFYMWKDIEPEDLVLQKSEISGAKWMLLSDCIEQTAQGLLPCLFPQELDLLMKETKEEV